MGTAALTYDRWRTLTDATGDGAIVDRHDIRAQFRAVGFGGPVEGARTFWHALYDVDDASAELSFYLHDTEGRSIYSEPIRFSLTADR